MGTPMAFTSGTTNGFSLGATKRATIALNPATSLVSGNNWFNGVDVSATQYLIYSDIFSQGQSTIPNSKPTAWTTPDLTDASLLALINTLPDRVGQVPYTDINVALQWLQNSEKYFLIKKGYEDIVTDGLVLNVDAGWYNSYPGSGTVWTDLSGEGNNGTLFNSPSFSSNGLGSLNFDGTDDYVETTNTNSLGNFTAEVWFYPTAVQNNSASIISTQYPGTNGTINYTMNWEGGIFRAGFYNGGWYQFTIQTPVLNRWNHYVLTYNGSIMIAYSGDSKPIGELVTSAIAAGGGPTRIGRRWDLNDIFLGQIAIARVYNRALSTTEILQNYDAQKSRFGFGGQSLFSGATQYLDFSKQSSYPGTGTNLNDVSGNGYNDTITDAAQVKYIDGVKCLDCSTGAQINGDTSNSPTLGNNYTIFTWARVISSTAGFRTLLRTFDDDHPLLVESNGNTIGYYDNNGGVFIASSLSVSTLGLADRWVLYTIVGSSGTQQTFYINQGTSNSTVSANATGEKMDDICNHSGQIFGPVGSCVVYNNQSFTQAQVAQYFNATKQYYGYTPDNVYGNGLSMYYNAGNPISYPGTGTTLYNLVGIGSNMVLYNGPTFSTSYGGVIQMDATDDYARVTSPNIILGTNPRTAILWFYATTSQYGCIYGFGNSPNGTPTYGSMELWNYADPLSLHYAGGSISSGLNLSTNTNKWLMCALIFDGTNASIRIIDNGTVYSNSAAVPLNTYSANYSINKSAYANEGGGMGGYIGISATYIRSFSGGEVTNFYNETKSRYGL